MKIKLDGGPEDLIRRLDTCNFCHFERILTPEQRKIKVLDYPIPENHIHRIVIEQICGKNYDGVCPMKYVAMRSPLNDDTGTQIGALYDLIWDLGKQTHREITLEEAAKKWTKDSQDIDSELRESYAKRFREVWNLGQRKGNQILTKDYIYETVRLGKEDYQKALEHLNKLLKEHEERDNIK